MSGKDDKGKGEKIFTYVVYALVAAAAVMVGVMIFSIIRGGFGGFGISGGSAAQSSGVVVNERNVKSIINRVDEEQVMPEEYYTVTMNYEWTFESGDAVSSDAYVENSQDNFYAVNFDVLLGEDEDIIYTSPILQVGDQLNEIKLKKNLEAGTYDAVVRYTLIDESGKDMSSVRVAVTIVVEN